MKKHRKKENELAWFRSRENLHDSITFSSDTIQRGEHLLALSTVIFI